MNKILRPVRGNYVLTFSYDDHVQYQKEHPNIIYNAGNERKYYKQYKAETSDNIMESNSFNPWFL